MKMVFSKKEIIDIVCQKCKKNENFEKRIKQESSWHFAPINIALIKYWGKDNEELKTPMSSSLSITSKHLGTKTKISVLNDVIIKHLDRSHDIVYLNNKEIVGDFATKIINILDLFRLSFGLQNIYFKIETINNMPT